MGVFDTLIKFGAIFWVVQILDFKKNLSGLRGTVRGPGGCRYRPASVHRVLSPKGPKIVKIQALPPFFQFSSEIENFKRATHQGPIFCVENSEGQD